MIYLAGREELPKRVVEALDDALPNFRFLLLHITLLPPEDLRLYKYEGDLGIIAGENIGRSFAGVLRWALPESLKAVSSGFPEGFLEQTVLSLRLVPSRVEGVTPHFQPFFTFVFGFAVPFSLNPVDWEATTLSIVESTADKNSLIPAVGSLREAAEAIVGGGVRSFRVSVPRKPSVYSSTKFRVLAPIVHIEERKKLVLLDPFSLTTLTTARWRSRVESQKMGVIEEQENLIHKAYREPLNKLGEFLEEHPEIKTLKIQPVGSSTNQINITTKTSKKTYRIGVWLIYLKEKEDWEKTCNKRENKGNPYCLELLNLAWNFTRILFP